MEKPMSRQNIPPTDSIQELARFWDTHDLSDFEDQLEEATQPVFERKVVLQVQLQPEEIEIVNEMAKSKGVDSEALIREWVLERLQPS